MARSLVTRIIRLVVTAMVGVSLAIIACAGWVSYHHSAAMARQRQETAMQVAWHVLRDAGEPFTRDGDILRAGKTPINGFNQPVDTIKSTVGGTATVFAGDMRIATNVTNPDGSRAIGTRLTSAPVRQTVLVGGKPFRGLVQVVGHAVYAGYDPIKSADGKVIGILYTGIAADEYTGPVYRGVLITALLSLVITTLATLLVVRAAKTMLQPLQDLSDTLKQMARDDTHVIIPHTGRSDEIGGIAGAMAILQASDKTRREAEAAQGAAMAIMADRLDALAQGDLTVRVASALPPGYEAIGRDFDASALALGNAMRGISESSDRIHRTANEVRAATHDLSLRTEEQAGSLNETAGTVRDYADAARQTAAFAREADTAMGTLQDRLTTSDAIMAQTADAMQAIAASSSEIAEIASLIDGIAFQTNLLALNAGVEAARAGDAGRGFAVVASEVRALAQRSAEAARDVKDRIARSSTEVGQGVDMVARIASTLSEAGADIGKVGALMRQIAGAAQTQSAGVAQISTVMGKMDSMTQQNTAMVEQTTAATCGLSDEANALHAAIARFRLGQDENQMVIEGPVQFHAGARRRRA